MNHRWSGFPGAWCLDCGCECAEEICMGECLDAPDPSKPEGYQCPNPEHHSKPCPGPRLVCCERCGRLVATEWDPDKVGTDGLCYRQVARGQTGRSGKRRKATTDCLKMPQIDWQKKGECLMRVIKILEEVPPTDMALWSESGALYWYQQKLAEVLSAAKRS